MLDYKLQLFNMSERHQRLSGMVWSWVKELEQSVLHSDWPDYRAGDTEGELMHSENLEAPWSFTYLVGRGLMPFIDAKDIEIVLCFTESKMHMLTYNWI